MLKQLIRYAVVVLTLFATSQVSALITVGGDCTWDEATGTLTCPRGGGGGGGGDPGGGLGGGCGLNCRDGDGTNMGTKPKTSDDFKLLFEKAQAWCKSDNESCTDWGQRRDAGICRTFVYAISVCIIAVQEEVTSGCKIVSKCP